MVHGSGGGIINPNSDYHCPSSWHVSGDEIDVPSVLDFITDNVSIMGEFGVVVSWFAECQHRHNIATHIANNIAINSVTCAGGNMKCNYIMAEWFVIVVNPNRLCNPAPMSMILFPFLGLSYSCSFGRNGGGCGDCCCLDPSVDDLTPEFGAREKQLYYWRSAAAAAGAMNTRMNEPPKNSDSPVCLR